MAFSAQSRSQLRDRGLGYLSARFAALGRTALTAAGGFFYVVFDVLGVILEGYEQRAASLTDQIFPDTASPENLVLHGKMDGVPRKGASPAIAQAKITGTPNATATFTARTVLRSPTGTAYTPCDASGNPITSATLDSSGQTVIHLRCATPGSSGALVIATILTWSNTPTGLSSTALADVLHKVRLTGTPSATVTFGSNRLLSATGVRYSPRDINDESIASVTLNGSGYADIYAEIDSANVIGVLPSGAILNWSPSTPVNCDTSATVQAGYGPILGADAETDPDWAARLLERRRERPSSGNRADWRAWAESVVGVEEAYVYPLYLSGGSPAYPLRGALTVAILGKAPSPPTAGTSSRLLSSGDVARVVGFIEGTNDSAGRSLPADQQEQLRPCGLSANDYAIVVPGTNSVAVTLTVTLSGIGVPTWSALATTTGSSTTSVKTTTDPLAAGVTAGDWIGVESPSVRGQYEYVRVASVTTTDIVLASDTPLSAAPASGRDVRPSSSNASAIRDALLTVFDRLGPGTPAGAVRWPTESEIGPSTLYRSSLIAAVQSLPGVPGAPPGVSGVVGVTLSAPASDQTLTGVSVHVPGKITLSVAAA